jgi:hypothetical protein
MDIDLIDMHRRRIVNEAELLSIIEALQARVQELEAKLAELTPMEPPDASQE